MFATCGRGKKETFWTKQTDARGGSAIRASLSSSCSFALGWSCRRPLGPGSGGKRWSCRRHAQRGWPRGGRSAEGSGQRCHEGKGRVLSKCRTREQGRCSISCMSHRRLQKAVFPDISQPEREAPEALVSLVLEQDSVGGETDGLGFGDRGGKPEREEPIVNEICVIVVMRRLEVLQTEKPGGEQTLQKPLP